MKADKVSEHIVSWLRNYSEDSGTQGFVVGISGGIDSALTSVLCALTGKRVILLSMPIRQGMGEFSRGEEHIADMKKRFSNCESQVIDLSPVLESCEKSFPLEIQDFLVMANTRARLRMTALYAFATHHKLLVAGTGNKVEDFGIGFFTKYGDGGVDLSPIADLYKTEVYNLARHLQVVESILEAKPTDGLFDDGRTDEDQIGASYAELEGAMEYIRRKENRELSGREQTVMDIYLQRHRANLHKVQPIPVCIIPEQLK
jgi:NAD+ synthase